MEGKAGWVGAAVVGMSLLMAILSRKWEVRSPPGPMGRWLVEDDGKSGFIGAQQAPWEHRAHGPSMEQEAWCGRREQPAESRAGLHSRRNCKSVSKRGESWQMVGAGAWPSPQSSPQHCPLLVPKGDLEGDSHRGVMAVLILGICQTFLRHLSHMQPWGSWE